jgi:hypothetical protein
MGKSIGRGVVRSNSDEHKEIGIRAVRSNSDEH